YAFWGARLTEGINERTADHVDGTVVNLASNEYFSAVDQGVLEGPLLTPVFQEVKDGRSRVISFMAKKARGAMARFMVRNRVERVEQLREFDVGGYRFDPEASGEHRWIFRRPQPPPASAKRARA
ncbi:MAG: peroxide stress protein YaaA, partial [Myxococcota bacterium]|nr:peroxide stress protein YaaA [Myxococcota bacterium]